VVESNLQVWTLQGTRSRGNASGPCLCEFLSLPIQFRSERAEDLVFVHSNLRHLSRRTDAYKKGETRMWDVGGDSFDSLSGVGLLEVAELSIDEPELQAVSFGLDDAEVEGVEESETIEEDQEA